MFLTKSRGFSDKVMAGQQLKADPDRNRNYRYFVTIMLSLVVTRNFTY